MTALPMRRRDSLTPAFLAAVALHVGLFAAVIFFKGSMPVPAGDVVPINIVPSAPTTDSRPAEVAPVAQAAQVETPVPQEKAPTPPPAPTIPAPPQPTPTPPKAVKAKPTPSPAPVKPAPAAKPQPDKPNFLDALQMSIARAAKTSPQRPAFAARGPTRAETAPVARVDAGQGVSQSDLQGLQQLLERLWNPNCSVEGGEGLVVPVKFSVGDDGQVVGRVTDRSASDPVAAAAATRAIDAVHQAEPFAAPYRGKTFTVNFDAQKACAKGGR